jgi:hypothetical protein
MPLLIGAVKGAAAASGGARDVSSSTRDTESPQEQQRWLSAVIPLAVTYGPKIYKALRK